MSTKYTPNQQRMLDLMRSMPGSDFASYEFVDLIRTTMVDRQRSWVNSSEFAQMQQAKTAQRALRAEREAEAAQIRGDWARRNVEPGMIIKVTGTRDAHGMRKVLRVERNSVVCIQLTVVHRGQIAHDVIEVRWPDGRTGRLQPGSQITTHGYDKVMHYGVADLESIDNDRFNMQKVPNA